MKKLHTITFFTFHFLLLTLLCSAQYTDLFNFSGTNGNFPLGDLTVSLSGKVLYGTTNSGGILS